MLESRQCYNQWYTMKLLPSVLICILFCARPSFGDDLWLGPTDILVADSPDTLYILEQDARRIRKVNVNGQAASQFLKLPAEPTRMRLFPDKKMIAVVGGGARGRLWIVDLATFSLTKDIPVGHTPSDVAIVQNVDGHARLYVANRFDGDITVYDTKPKNEESPSSPVSRIPAGREPIALAATPGGRTLIVVGHLPEDAATNSSISSRVRFIDTLTPVVHSCTESSPPSLATNGHAPPYTKVGIAPTQQTKVLSLDAGAMNIRDLVLTPDGRYAFLTGIVGHFTHIPNSVTGGWTNENILFVVDVAGRRMVTSHSLDDFAIGSANPWGVSLSDDARFLLVAASGSGDVLLINLTDFVRMLDDFAGYTKRQAAQHDSINKPPMQLRVPVGLKGVRHAVMTKDRIFATAYFEDALARIDPQFAEPLNYAPGALPQDTLEIPRRQRWSLRPDTSTPLRSRARLVSVGDDPGRKTPVEINPPDTHDSLQFTPLPDFSFSSGIRFKRSFARLGPEPAWSEVRYGEMLFHDATLCEEHWQSCATCHPEGRSDSLNWDLQNDGQDNPKNSKSMLLAHETPPSMAHGVRDRAETAVRKGFETILMIPASEEEAKAVDAYLSSLKPVPSPWRVFGSNGQGTLSEAAQRGKRIFNSDRGGCYTCHPEPLYTDMNRHDVGSRNSFDSDAQFDTPSLVEVWRTAPYLHDGRYTTIMELIVEGRHAQTHGQLEKLTEHEIDDLVNFVLSL